MKKWISFALTAVLVLNLCGCAGLVPGESANKDPGKEESKPVTASMMTGMQVTEYDADGEKTASSTVLVYDDDYNLTVFKVYNGDKLQREMTFRAGMIPLKQQYYTEDGQKDRYYESTYDENDNELSYFAYDAEGNVDWGYTFTYDANGKMLTEKSYYGEEYDSETRYSYNADGKVEATTTTYANGSEEWTKFTYNSHGRILTETSGRGENTTETITYEYTYDGDQLVEYKCYEDGELSRHAKYDSDGHRILYVGYDDGEESSRNTSTYENGRLVEDVYVYDGVEYSRQVYSYGENGDLISMKEYREGKLCTEIVPTYETVTVSKEIAEVLKEIQSMVNMF